MSDSLFSSFLMRNVSELLRSLTKKERREQIPQVAHQKWGTMSDSLSSLTKIEWPWANRSGRWPKMSQWANRSFFWANRSFAHFFAKKRAIHSENRWMNSQPCFWPFFGFPDLLCYPYLMWFIGWSVNTFFDRTEQVK